MERSSGQQNKPVSGEGLSSMTANDQGLTRGFCLFLSIYFCSGRADFGGKAVKLEYARREGQVRPPGGLGTQYVSSS